MSFLKCDFPVDTYSFRNYRRYTAGYLVKVGLNFSFQWKLIKALEGRGSNTEHDMACLTEKLLYLSYIKEPWNVKIKLNKLLQKKTQKLAIF